MFDLAQNSVEGTKVYIELRDHYRSIFALVSHQRTSVFYHHIEWRLSSLFLNRSAWSSSDDNGKQILRVKMIYGAFGFCHCISLPLTIHILLFSDHHAAYYQPYVVLAGPFSRFFSTLS
ncbi:uncharacterized protein EV420DRAFT_1489011 [Desarmillaria tabescens]|uniref:Uncharacterized protein n=1 Tax=Armillaria tabescens TaxID=1929756 RepID=A0AA39MH53_ARMTA|nr:uncharacterized protein EV420DRAFT_1489011 [Desarmillaria tabescens]KAK0433668.1 hypothetical protein EV420DRAFT_1489011 [Desarmillaria tabescens]